MTDTTTTTLATTGSFDPTEFVVSGFLAGYKGRTREAYICDLKLWGRWCNSHQLALLTVARAHIELFARHEEDRGLMPSSVNRRLGTISSFYRYAHLEGFVDRDPAAHIRRPKVPQESTTLGLDRVELGSFIAAASSMSVKHHALACLLGLNGLRVSELCSLDIESLSTERGHTVCRKAGITKRISPHSLRHSAITAALDANVPLRDVQDFARRADPRTTTRYDRNRHNLDRNATYIISAFVAP